jgi:hypothetical protein
LKTFEEIKELLKPPQEKDIDLIEHQIAQL